MGASALMPIGLDSAIKKALLSRALAALVRVGRAERRFYDLAVKGSDTAGCRQLTYYAVMIMTALASSVSPVPAIVAPTILLVVPGCSCSNPDSQCLNAIAAW